MLLQRPHNDFPLAKGSAASQAIHEQAHSSKEHGHRVPGQREAGLQIPPAHVQDCEVLEYRSKEIKKANPTLAAAMADRFVKKKVSDKRSYPEKLNVFT